MFKNSHFEYEILKSVGLANKASLNWLFYVGAKDEGHVSSILL